MTIGKRGSTIGATEYPTFKCCDLNDDHFSFSKLCKSYKYDLRKFLCHKSTEAN